MSVSKLSILCREVMLLLACFVEYSESAVLETSVSTLSELFIICPIQYAGKLLFVRRGANKSLARPTSRCRRTESWKTAGFRLNQYLSNWASYVSGLGPTFVKIWTCGMSPRGLVPARQCPVSPDPCNPEDTGLPGLPMS
jgi:hypothetical protein